MVRAHAEGVRTPSCENNLKATRHGENNMKATHRPRAVRRPERRTSHQQDPNVPYRWYASLLARRTVRISSWWRVRHRPCMHRVGEPRESRLAGRGAATRRGTVLASERQFDQRCRWLLNTTTDRAFTFRQTVMCFAMRSGAKVRPHWLQHRVGWRTGDTLSASDDGSVGDVGPRPSPPPLAPASASASSMNSTSPPIFGLGGNPCPCPCPSSSAAATSAAGNAEGSSSEVENVGEGERDADALDALDASLRSWCAVRCVRLQIWGQGQGFGRRKGVGKSQGGARVGTSRRELAERVAPGRIRIQRPSQLPRELGQRRAYTAVVDCQGSGRGRTRAHLVVEWEAPFAE